MIRQLLLLAGLFASSALVAYSADNPGGSSSAPSESVGRWVTESGNLEVDLTPSGEGLIGTVTRVISNRSMSGSEPAVPAADAPPLLGLKILDNLVSSGKNEWKGQIYNRDNGKTYDCVVTFVPPDQLHVRGYKLLPLFGKTQIWRRVASDGQAAMEPSGMGNTK